MVKTQVGDKYVVEEMKKNGFNLGGEPSGHIIFLDHTTTGDGCIAALSVLAVMKQMKSKLSDLNDFIKDVPQVLINCRVKNRTALSEIKGYAALVKEVEAELKGEGRIFVRYSGTEPLIRVLVEGFDKFKISEIAEKLAHFLEKELA